MSVDMPDVAEMKYKRPESVLVIVYKQPNANIIETVDQVKALSEADRRRIFEGNARRVFPRLGPRTAREVNRVGAGA